MGCVGGKEQGGKKGAKASSIIKAKKDQQPPSIAAAAPVAQAKLTLQQIQQKRQIMKNSLEQGHAVPPSMAAPDFGAVASFNVRD